MIFKSTSSTLTIGKNVIDVWNKFRQKNLWNKEACGVLIGTSNTVETEVCFEIATIPMKQDFRRRNKFKIMDPRHQERVNSEWGESSHSRFYLGYWHTHPQSIPVPSSLDRTEWQNNYRLNKINMNALYYPIIGTKEVVIWQVSKDRVIEMEKCGYENY